MRLLLALIAGGLFGSGLFISGMTDTTKVQGWLDVFGNWDPTLAFVMGGAMIPMAVAWAFARRRRVALLGSALPARPEQSITPSLAAGSALFGIGWGLAGFCPGPAMASISFGGVAGLVFLLAMVAGMFITGPMRARLAPLSS